MKKIFLAIFCSLLVVSGLYAQKRNIIANSNFEEANTYQHWRVVGNATDIVFGSETDNPISGTKSAKITSNLNLGTSFFTMFQYYFPVKKGISYDVKFKVKANVATNLTWEFCQNHAPWDFSFRGPLSVGTNVTEFSFTTPPMPASDYDYKISFHFGDVPAGTTYLIDDISVTWANGSWDGNLIPQGDFEDVVIGTNDGFDINGNGSIVNYSLVSGVIDGKALRIQKTANGGWWDANLFMFYWSTEGAHHQVSFDTKAQNGSTIGSMTLRTNEEPWNTGGTGDVLGGSYQFNTGNPQNNVLNQTTNQYGSYRQAPAYGAGYDGLYKLFSGLGDGITPVGFDGYIDNIKLTEIVPVNNITIIGPDVIAQSARYDIGIMPTHAENSVFWSVTNGTGQASITADGRLNGTVNGTVTVRAVSKVNTSLVVTKQVELTNAETAVIVFRMATNESIQLLTSISDLVAPGHRVVLVYNVAPNNNPGLGDSFVDDLFVNSTTNPRRPGRIEHTISGLSEATQYYAYLMVIDETDQVITTSELLTFATSTHVVPVPIWIGGLLLLGIGGFSLRRRRRKE